MNTHTPSQKSLKRFGLALILATLAGTAIASEPVSEDADLLRGPEVVTSAENQSSDSKSDMSGMSQDEQAKALAYKVDQLPFRAFFNAVHGLRKAARDNPELALTDEQIEQIDAIAEQHRVDMDEFLEKHHDEIAQYRGQLPPAPPMDHPDRHASGDRNTPPPPPTAEEEYEAERRENIRKMDASMSPEMRKANMEKLAKLMETAPPDAAPKAKVLAILSADQKQAVQETLTKIVEQRDRRTNMAMGRRGGRAQAPSGEASQRKSRDQKSRGNAKRSNQESEDGDD